MNLAYFVLATISIVATLVPFLPHQHWIVRCFDFGKIQFACLSATTLVLGFIFAERSAQFWTAQSLLLACLLYDLSILVRYTPLYRVKESGVFENHSDSVTLVSANVLQFNTSYDRFVQLIRDVQPDMFMTMESNEDWDTAMRVLESDYPYLRKVPLENTYGIHLYSKLEMSTEVHYFVADDLPSIEAKVVTREGDTFTLFCVHPPPPSPTEESNSKERDGELLAVAKKIRDSCDTTVVVGDFNNVSWSRSSVLFRKTTEMIDPRMGRMLAATFNAKSRFLRFPIDQIYHTTDVFTQELRTLPYFGSDHFPLFCQFYIDRKNGSQEELTEDLEPEELEEVDELVEEGVKEESDRDDVAEE
jgi:endonuclease/exonuclease/phosphatase (EEP) superfamily protein YafD